MKLRQTGRQGGEVRAGGRVLLVGVPGDERDQVAPEGLRGSDGVRRAGRREALDDLAELVLSAPVRRAVVETLDELDRNLQEVIAMLLEDGEPKLESEFIGVHNVAVA